MNSPRVDLYTAVHKALRFDMYQTGSLLARTNFADGAERDAALAALDRSVAFFAEHLQHEDRHVMPRLESAAPDLARELGGDHVEHEETFGALRALRVELASVQGGDAIGLGVKLCRAWNAMVAHQSVHMNREESAANGALWAAYTDDELAATRAAVQGSIPPPRFVEWMHIMAPNMNHQELAGMLTGMKMAAPPEVFARMSGLVQQLVGSRWVAIAAALPA
jgi:hypothetical protein